MTGGLASQEVFLRVG